MKAIAAILLIVFVFVIGAAIYLAIGIGAAWLLSFFVELPLSLFRSGAVIAGILMLLKAVFN